EGEEGEEVREEGGAAGGGAGGGDARGVEWGVAAAHLEQDEARQDRDTAAQAGQGARRQPAVAGGLDDRVHQRDHAGNRQHGAADVEAGGGRGGRPRHGAGGADAGGGGPAARQ